MLVTWLNMMLVKGASHKDQILYESTYMKCPEKIAL